MKYSIYFVLLFFALIKCTDSSDKLFVAASSAATGIKFANTIQAGDSLSVLDAEYLYNGGGVAIGDINNDGLQDVYFTGNMSSSRLYLNQGNLEFEDITEKSGVGTTKWANGAAIVDINQDGFKDIYVSVGGTRNTPEKDRANLLFINNGDMTFTESAVQYGLADSGYGIQSAFFDFDMDGDLDMYLLRNSFVNYPRNNSRPKSINGEAASTDKLFRNNGDLTFTDVSQEAGILIEGFGLGVGVSDINEDGWPDVYVSNDFVTNDLLYINNHDGTFTNRISQYLKHQTFNGMGTDVADYNNDGKVDIVVLDMLPEDNKRWKLTSRGNSYDEFQNGIKNGYEHQYIRNTLQLNNGNGTFSEIGQLAGVEATEWSWSALLADYDNDGLKDLFISNGYKQDIINLDFIVYGDKEQSMGMPEADDKERLKLLNELPGIKVHNYMYKNNGDLTFSDVSEAWGLSAPTYSNGAAYADLDNDGDLDLVTNNLDEEASVWESHARQSRGADQSNYMRISLAGPPTNLEGIGTKVFLRNKGTLQYQYFSPFRGYLSTVEPFLHFGLGASDEADTVEILWPDGKYQMLQHVKANQVLRIDYAAAKERILVEKAVAATLFEDVTKASEIDFIHEENIFVDFKLQPILPHMHSLNGPGVTAGDVNGDGLEDFYVGGAAGFAGAMFMQQPGGKFKRKSMTGMDSLSEEMGVLLFDADNDNDLDLYTVSGGSEQIKESALYQDHLYLNDGGGNFAAAPNALPAIRQSGSCVVGSDYDRDGDLDLFIGGRIIPGEYPLPAGSFLLRNDSKGAACRFTDVTDEVEGLRKTGLVCSGLWTDYDNDGWIDLMVVGEFMPVRFYHNEKGRLIDATNKTDLTHTSGWWNSIAGGDFDGDGDTDYVLGNLGLNTHFHANEEEPLCVYASDYNKDGRIDPVMTYYVQGKKYVGHSRDNLIDQINSIRGRFRTYTDYANATFEESFLPEELKEAYVVCSERFESSYLENLGKGKFKISGLPLVAQFSPIYGMVTGDYDDDGNLDVLLVGNSYSPEISSGRDDACIGLYLSGNGKGGFRPVSVTKSGFLADRDAKGMARMVSGDGRELVIVGNNDNALQAYATQHSGKYYRAEKNDAYAIVTLKNGQLYRHEFYYGSTYFSQSSRDLKLSPEMTSVKVFDFQGNDKEIVVNAVGN
ncbi:MAG: VCBS repeat-containing protein [Cyclobacteriaceae bacterium]|nr:VCBS repeat-containing protein [Cyclobacteriaceae bacterium]MDH4298161.1 VCBS repeat-containing protein [Cyclobacteriaceae bacterium]MDH5249801.1 VCBS repeat-containing protein [Cyclobacteriaceae bacterium]